MAMFQKNLKAEFGLSFQLIMKAVCLVIPYWRENVAGAAVLRAGSFQNITRYSVC